MNNQTIIFVIVGLMAVLFVVDLFSFFKRSHRDFRSVIVSLGVLGTFVGVFVGLLGFDSNDIRGSVPMLLEGMKTAFFTSVVGLALSVVLAIVQRASGFGSDDEAAALNDVARQLGALSTLEETIRREQRETREQLSEQLAITRESIDSALQQFSGDASNDLVKALREVVEDFNSTVNAQFGENFQALNESVGALVRWQTGYAEQIESERALLAQTRDSLSQSSQTLESIAQRNQETQDVYHQLSSMIESASVQTQKMQIELDRYGDAGEKARASLGQLEQSLIKVNEGVETQVHAMSRVTQELSRQLPNSLNALDNTLSALTARFAKDYESFLQQYKQLVR